MNKSDLAEALHAAVTPSRVVLDHQDLQARGRRRGLWTRTAGTFAAIALIAGLSLVAIGLARPSIQEVVVASQPPVASDPAPPTATSSTRQPSPPASPTTGAEWGPLAVENGQPNPALAGIFGTLEITAECVRLVYPGGPALLQWPSATTSWDEASRQIEFTSLDGERHTFSDGNRVSFSGSTTTDPGSVPWAKPPDSSCSYSEIWGVGHDGSIITEDPT